MNIAALDYSVLVEDVLNGTCIFDRMAFKQVIESSKRDDQKSLILVTFLFFKFSELYCLTKKEKDDWYFIISSISDIDLQVRLMWKFYSVIIKDSPNSETYLNYLNFIIDNVDDGDYDIQFILDQFHSYFDLFGTDFEGSHAVSELYLTLLNDIKDIKNHYLSRLRIKHKQLDLTFENYSKFITENFPDSYQKEMKYASISYNSTKKDQYDLELQYVRNPQKTSTKFWIELLDFIASTPKKKRDVKQLRSIFENAINEVNDIEIWKRFLLLIYEHGATTYIINLIEFLFRFIKTFPDLSYPYIEYLRNILTDYSRYEAVEPRLQRILQAEIDFEDWKELILSHLKVLFENDRIPDDSIIQSYLKRAFETPDNTFHTVERFIVALYEKAGEIENARSILREITNHYTTETEVWLISYYFEKKHGDVSSVIKILKAAINRSEQLDWPERIFEEALRYSLLYGDDYKFISSKIEKKKLELWSLRSQEINHFKPRLTDEIVVDSTVETSKRHLGPEVKDLLEPKVENSPKKRKTEPIRDREHLTIAVVNIPQHISGKQIINFFKDCGIIHGIKITSIGDTNQANLEFTNNDDVLKALTKDYKKLAGNELRVSRLLKSTVWVTNFPPSYTQEKLEQVFISSGKIISIRLPSLKFNSQRRFCYIEYTNAEAAAKAVEDYNNRELEGYKLTVKISDPLAKQNRSGATEEGREVYASKLDCRKVTADKVKQLFSKYGNVQNVHLPLSKKSEEQGKKHDGYGFIIFSTPEEAQLAVLELNLVNFEGRVIEVSVSKKKSERTRQKENNAFKNYVNSERAIAIKNLDNSISADCLKDIFSSEGNVEDIILEPSHKGAIVVFSDAKHAGSAALKFEGTKIGDNAVRVTTVKDLKRQNTETKSTMAKLLVPSNVRRRPKLLTKTTLSSTKTSKSTQCTNNGNTECQSQTSTIEQQKPKSNDDFRALIFGKK